ncbi:MAG: hypothetical protein J5717_04950 [Lachnospiraceae bacterium]|nr:hypothetical protein [Lachnospiraceae bacterium]
MGLVFFKLILLPILMLAATIGLTLAVEFPIIYYSGITRNKKYIVAVNALTNVCLNVGLVFFFLASTANAGGWTEYASVVWTLFAEVLLIPVVEARLYMKVSTQPKKRIWILTYVANIASYLIGALIFALVFGGAEGISMSLMRFLLGGL